MKIVVDKMPETPKDCLFSELSPGFAYMCKLEKPKCVCKNTGKCNKLSTIRNEHMFL